MRAGARPHNEEESVLNLAMQPDNAGQAAEHFTLATFTQDGLRVAGGLVEIDRNVHARTPVPTEAWLISPGLLQFPQELRGIHGVDGVSRKCEKHQCVLLQRGKNQCKHIGGMQGNHDKADSVFPEEGWGKQILARNVLLPQGAGDHDGI